MSEAALYRHFPSKTKMYEEIIGFAENYVMTAVNNISSSEYSGLEQAKKLFLALTDIKAKEAGLVFLFCGDSLTSEDPRLQAELNRFYGQLQAVFKQSLRLAVAQEEVPENYDVLTRANMLVALILGHWLRFAKRTPQEAPLILRSRCICPRQMIPVFNARAGLGFPRPCCFVKAPVI